MCSVLDVATHSAVYNDNIHNLNLHYLILKRYVEVGYVLEKKNYGNEARGTTVLK